MTNLFNRDDAFCFWLVCAWSNVKKDALGNLGIKWRHLVDLFSAKEVDRVDVLRAGSTPEIFCMLQNISC